MNDTIQQIIHTGVQFGTQLQHSNTLIRGVDNSLTTTILTILGGFIIRFFEKRALRKKGKLTK
jgi:hypothetical protein